jgi:hypothetical protein
MSSPFDWLITNLKGGAGGYIFSYEKPQQNIEERR